VIPEFFHYNELIPDIIKSDQLICFFSTSSVIDSLYEEKKKVYEANFRKERGENLIMLFSDEQTNSFAFYNGHIDREFIAKINWV
jgi:hypothetical protein